MDLPPDVVNYPTALYRAMDEYGEISDRFAFNFDTMARNCRDPGVRVEIEKLAKVADWLFEADCLIAARLPTPPLPV